MTLQTRGCEASRTVVVVVAAAAAEIQGCLFDVVLRRYPAQLARPVDVTPTFILTADCKTRCDTKDS